jgi:hypothetical protein
MKTLRMCVHVQLQHSNSCAGQKTARTPTWGSHIYHSNAAEIASQPCARVTSAGDCCLVGSSAGAAASRTKADLLHTAGMTKSMLSGRSHNRP